MTPFDIETLNALPPPHLRQLPGTTVADLAATVIATFGRAMPLPVAEQLTRLLDSHQVADARQLANDCQLAGAIGLAAAIDQVLLNEAAP